MRLYKSIPKTSRLFQRTGDGKGKVEGEMQTEWSDSEQRRAENLKLPPANT